MEGYSIKIEGKEYKICEPNFDVLALAFTQLISKGQADIIKAGQVIFDACYLGNPEELVEIQKNTKLYLSICLQAGSLIEVFDGEIKKN